MKTVFAYNRVLPADACFDVLVAGSGPAGIAAAISAAREGAKVLLAERYATVGGNLTNGHVSPLMGTLSRGTMAEEIGKALKRTDNHDHSLDTEYGKMVLPQLLQKEGITVWTGTAIADAMTEGNVVIGAILATQKGLTAVRCKCAVDCTGDGVLAALSGCPWEMGRKKDKLCQPASVMFLIGGIDHAQTLLCHHEEDETILPDGEGYLQKCHRACAEGILPPSVNIVRLYPTEKPGQRMVNATQVNKLSGLDPTADFTAQCELRRQEGRILEFLQKNIPGFEHASILASTEGAGFRETRRIKGEYTLSAEDLMSGCRFDDAVVHLAQFAIDIPNPDGAGQSESDTTPRQPKPYDIPYRCLVPLHRENILTAGRCISGTHEAHASYRVMNICMATGEAAGIAAALSAKQGISPRALDAESVRRVLMDRGVNLTEEE